MIKRQQVIDQAKKRGITPAELEEIDLQHVLFGG